MAAFSRLHNSVVVITGASAGVGRATADPADVKRLLNAVESR